MGNKWTKRFGGLFASSEPLVRVGMLGLDNAGKTTILYQLKLEQNVQPSPTIGFNVENVRCGKFMLNIWDVSDGHGKTRALWQHYNQNTSVIIFVVDSADVRRLPQASEYLRWLWTRKELAQAIFIIFANKQDLPDALRADELMHLLELQNLAQHWAIQECCATRDIGLNEAIQQLQQILEDMSRKNRLVDCIKH